MIRLALGIVALFLVLHVMGARTDVGLLSGTLPGDDLAGAFGLAYVAAWFAAVVAAPILAIAGVLSALLRPPVGYGKFLARLARWTSSRPR